MSVVGILWVVLMISPILRCHHISGSSKRNLTVITARGTRRPASIAGKEKTFCMGRTAVDSTCSRAKGISLRRFHVRPVWLDRAVRVCEQIRFGDPDQSMQVGAGDI